MTRNLYLDIKDRVSPPSGRLCLTVLCLFLDCTQIASYWKVLSWVLGMAAPPTGIQSEYFFSRVFFDPVNTILTLFTNSHAYYLVFLPSKSLHIIWVFFFTYQSSSVHVSTYVSVYPFICVSVYLCIHLSMYPCIHLSRYPCIHLSPICSFLSFQLECKI